MVTTKGDENHVAMRKSRDASVTASLASAARSDEPCAADATTANARNMAFFKAMPLLIEATASPTNHTRSSSFTQLAKDLASARSIPHFQPVVTVLGQVMAHVQSLVQGYDRAVLRATTAEQLAGKAMHAVEAMQATLRAGHPAVVDTAMQQQLQTLSAEVKSQEKRAAAAEQRAAAAERRAQEAAQAVAAMQAAPPVAPPAANASAMQAEVDALKESLAKAEATWSTVVRQGGRLRHVPAAAATPQATTQVRLVFGQQPEGLDAQPRSRAEHSQALSLARTVIGSLDDKAAVLGVKVERSKAAPTRVTLVVDISSAAYTDIMGLKQEINTRLQPHRCTLRRHLPPGEFAIQQALWAAHATALKAAIQAKRRFVFHLRTQEVFFLDNHSKLGLTHDQQHALSQRMSQGPRGGPIN